jgi:hypothetical protein
MAQNKECGMIPDGCGGMATCPTVCMGGKQCVNNACVCPGNPCAGKSCGTVADGCGGMVSCGSCASYQTCANNVCTCTSPSFTAAVLPIFTNRCATVACHDNNNPAEGLRLTAASAHAATVNVQSRQCGGTKLLIKPGDVAGSYLVDKLFGVNLCNGGQMPAGPGGNLTMQQIDSIRAWVCGGAPNN